jgi:3-phenylpropionate/cinnamic acid dioxygenase small subunit
MEGEVLQVTKLRSALSLTLVGALSAPLIAAADYTAQQLQDRAAIEELIVRYARALDTLDADAYASVFAEDADFEVGGTTYQGRSEIRAIVTRLRENRAAPRAEGDPAPPALYHIVTNTSIDLAGNDEAYHKSYYQTVRVGPGNQVVIGTMGRYEDRLVKRDGHWFIKTRKAINFARQ